MTDKLSLHSHWSKVPSLNFRVHPTIKMVVEGETKMYSTLPTRSNVPREYRPLGTFMFDHEYVFAYLEATFNRLGCSINPDSMRTLIDEIRESQSRGASGDLEIYISANGTEIKHNAVGAFWSEYQIALRLAAFYFGIEEKDKQSPRNKRAAMLADSIKELIAPDTFKQASDDHFKSLVGRL